MLRTGFITLPELIEQAVSTLERQANREAQGADLAGEDSAEPYNHVLRQIDQVIGKLKRERAYIQQLKSHVCEYDGRDYCMLCGRDGRV